MRRRGTDHTPIWRNLWRIACVSLGVITAACTASQPPPAPTYPVVSNYAPPPHRPARSHNRAAAPQTRDATKPPLELAPANIAPSEPVALLATPLPTPEIPGPGLGETQDAPPAPSPTNLSGLDQPRAANLLGPATVTESQGPATVWHYKNSRCELDLVFYMEMRSGQMRVLHHDFKGADNPQQRQACLRAIVQENSRNAANSQ
jgi:hypothetical protein